MTHQALIEALRSYTLKNIAAWEGTVLLLHDATELDYTSRKSLAKDLGQIGTGGGRGYICHQVLAVASETKSVLGLAEQILHCRAEVPKNETLTERRSFLYGAAAFSLRKATMAAAISPAAARVSLERSA